LIMAAPAATAARMTPALLVSMEIGTSVTARYNRDDAIQFLLFRDTGRPGPCGLTADIDQGSTVLHHRYRLPHGCMQILEMSPIGE
jgi:hypothetical protein